MITAIVQYRLPPHIDLAIETACITDNAIEAVLLPGAAEQREG